jgi:hypothetical protein
MGDTKGSSEGGDHELEVEFAVFFLALCEINARNRRFGIEVFLSQSGQRLGLRCPGEK